MLHDACFSHVSIESSWSCLSKTTPHGPYREVHTAELPGHGPLPKSSNSDSRAQLTSLNQSACGLARTCRLANAWLVGAFSLTSTHKIHIAGSHLKNHWSSFGLFGDNCRWKLYHLCNCHPIIHHSYPVPSAKHLHSHGTSPFVHGKTHDRWPFSIANCYSLPEGNPYSSHYQPLLMHMDHHSLLMDVQLPEATVFLVSSHDHPYKTIVNHSKS